MNHYEEKKQARIDYYNEKAAEAEKRSKELVGQSSDMLSAIPFGQPILVGHHSETRDRNYRDRANNKMRQGIAESDKAAYYASKAEAAENNKAISADNPDALEQLKAKAEALQARQEEMKKANAYFRKNKTMRGYAGLSDDEADRADQRIKDAYSWQQQPYPAYKLQNNNANIRRIHERIKELENKSAISATDGWEFDGGTVVMNVEYNRIQILFDDKPNEDIRKELKSRGFKWAPSQGAWQRQLNGNGLYAVRQIKSIQPASA